MEYRDKRNGSLKTIATMYIYTLPLRMIAPFTILKSYFSVCANYTAFLFHITGFLVLVLLNARRFTISIISKRFLQIILALDSISVLNAFVYHKSFGTIDGEGTFSAISTILVYYFHYATIMIFNERAFSLFTRSELLNKLKKLIKIVQVFGYFQLIVMIIGGPFASIYDAINIFGSIRPSSYLLSLGRLPLLGSEPAAAGAFIGIFVFPILLTDILLGEKKAIQEFISWLPLLFFTRSSTAYILFVADLIVFMLFSMKEYGNSKGKTISLSLIIALGISFIVSDSVMTASNNEVFSTIHFYFQKIFDHGNESTVTRTIPTYINFSIFLRYPFTGVGNGCQGFFYKEFFPSWGEVSRRTYNLINGVADGGVAVPSFFSGYGIIGVLLILYYFRSTRRFVHRYKEKMGPFFYIYTISLFVIFINGFQSDYFGTYYVLFMLSLPQVVFCKTEQGGILIE